MFIFYSLLLAGRALLSLPWWLVQMLRLGKYRSGLRERLGFVPERLKDVKPGAHLGACRFGGRGAGGQPLGR